MAKKLYWWEADKGTTFQAVFDRVRWLDDHQPHHHDILCWLRLYGNLLITGFGPTTHNFSHKGRGLDSRLTLNLIQPITDSLVNKITQSRPRVQILTDMGDFSLRRKAKQLTKFLDGMFEKTEFYEQALRAFHDTCWAGTGLIKIFRSGDQIKAERVFPGEIKVDDSEAMHGTPVSLHQTKFIHRSVLMKMFPSKRGEIERVTAADKDRLPFHHQEHFDMIEVIESWHLPSVKGAEDGKHAISIDNTDLLVEGWEKMYFPFVVMKFSERPLGFWGIGVSEILMGDQMEVNKLLRTLQISFHLFGIPKVLQHIGTKIVESRINNRIGGIIKYSGQKPTFESMGTAIPVEILRMLDWLYARAFEKIGISQLSAQSKKPSGLDSSPALREFLDTESARFFTLGKRWEFAYVDAALIMIDLAKEIAKDTGNFSVDVKGKTFLEKIDWSEVDMDDDVFSMKPFPVNFLPQQPGARLAKVQELLQGGLIRPEDGRRLLDFPDIESVTSIENAQVEDIDFIIEKMADEGEYLPPEPFQNLELGVQKVQLAYLKFRTENLPEENLELLRRWVKEAQTLVNDAIAQQQAGQAQIPAPGDVVPTAAPGDLGPPQALTEPLPTSDLLPNVPAAPPIVQ